MANELDIGDMDIVLSSSEKRRLMRAIFRWHIYSNLFETGTNFTLDSHGGLVHKVAREEFSVEGRIFAFYAMFAPWEREEMTTVYEYANSRYKECFDGHRDPIFFYRGYIEHIFLVDPSS